MKTQCVFWFAVIELIFKRAKVRRRVAVGRFGIILTPFVGNLHSRGYTHERVSQWYRALFLPLRRWGVSPRGIRVTGTQSDAGEFYPTGQAGGLVVVTDSGMTDQPRRFYQVVVPQEPCYPGGSRRSNASKPACSK